MPLSHLTLTVGHLPTSTSFFLSCLQPIGYKFIGRHEDYIGFGQNSDEPADFWIREQKPGVPAGAAHIAFPAPSKDAVGSFFISALKAGGTIHGEPKTRDSDSGYYSAAVVDFDGNSIEAVYRPGSSSARSDVSRPALALLENGSVVSKASSKVSSIKPDNRSDVRSYVTKATTAVDRAAPSERTGASVVSRNTPQPSSSSPTYVVHTTQKKDDGTTAKTIVGTLIGAAAGAAIAYAMSKGDSDSSEILPPPQYSAREFLQLESSSRAPSQIQEVPGYRAIEAPPPRSTYSQFEGRPGLTRSVTSKNPRASTIYEGTEYVPRGNGGSVYMDENGRRASEGSVYGTRDLPLRAIEYPPGLDNQNYPCNPSTFISSFPDKSRVMDKGSVYSSSTIKPSKAKYEEHHSSHHSIHHRSSHHSSHRSSSRPNASNSTASSTRTARNIPLPEGSSVSYHSGAKSGVSARDVPLPRSTLDDYDVGPEDSISQIGDSRRSSHSHRSHASKAGSRVSRHSSKFDEPVKPSDSISQVSSHASRASQRTIKAGGGSKTGSKVSISASRRGSQVA
ncbi:hypothetical protein FE257_008733 [Aspergillus nanangensis]|uniref:VOC domain-containing protein n=1 Tax=Aspergillus nanangensis TaxID=2582783 RepID=A0AAD4CKY8_ASPNN|nr:hypothetical protein FE257_008733 [Aspergillus nanangensis]